eukprot:Nitzschia sp. Nitz4//scaffold85_size83877//127//6296//NITZ4_005215-RA/size83877-snap-gene-0.12-mRNA-1//-1//CDS//3329559095//6084//frame0
MKLSQTISFLFVLPLVAVVDAGCCSQKHKTCDVGGSSCNAGADACESDCWGGGKGLLWLEQNGAENDSSCLARWAGSCSSDDDCCGTLFCAPGNGWRACTHPEDYCPNYNKKSCPTSGGICTTKGNSCIPAYDYTHSGMTVAADPTPSPVSTTTVTGCDYVVTEENEIVGFPDGALDIVSSDGNLVTFSINQLWKSGGSISWIAPIYAPAGGSSLVCEGSDKEDEVKYEASTGPFTAQCADGVASIVVAVHDGSFTQKGVASEDVYNCDGWPKPEGVAVYKVALPCCSKDADPTAAPVAAKVAASSTAAEDSECLDANVAGSATMGTTTSSGTSWTDTQSGDWCSEVNNLGEGYSESSDYSGEYPTLGSTPSNGAGYDDNVAVLIGGSYYAPEAAEIEGRAVVLGDFIIGALGTNSIGRAGIGSGIVPSYGTVHLAVGGNLDGGKTNGQTWFMEGAMVTFGGCCLSDPKNAKADDSWPYPDWKACGTMFVPVGSDEPEPWDELTIAQATLDPAPYLEVFDELRVRSEYWFSLQPNGVISQNNRKFTFSAGDDRCVQVFELTYDMMHYCEINGSCEFTFDSSLEDKTILVNVSPYDNNGNLLSEVTLTGISLMYDMYGNNDYDFSTKLKQHLLWNFYNAANVVMGPSGNLQFPGSVIVPYGSLHFQWVGQDGRLMVYGDVTHDANGSEFHNYDFKPECPLPLPPTIPTPTDCDGPGAAPTGAPTGAPVTSPTSPTKSPVATGDYTCELPDYMRKYTFITSENANIAAKNWYTGFVVGEELYANIGNQVSVYYNSSSGLSDSEKVSYYQSFDGLNIKANYWEGTWLQCNGCTIEETDDPLAAAGVDWAQLEWLTKNVKNSTSGEFSVFVVTSGGSVNQCDFIGDVTSEDNSRTLIFFNTEEDIVLDKCSTGKKWGPSVIAPWSKVTLPSGNDFTDGIVYSREFVSENTNQQIHGSYYVGPIECSPTTSGNCDYVVTEENEIVGFPDDALEVVSSNGDSVSFKIHQFWKPSGSISWIAPIYTPVGGSSLVCEGSDKEDEVGYEDFTGPFTAQCTDGVASMVIAVHDGSFWQQGVQTDNVYGCDGWPAANPKGVAVYSLDVPCCSSDAEPTAAPTASPTASPTKSPTAGPTAAPTKSPTTGPTAAPTKSPTAGPTASPTASPTKTPTAGPTSAPVDATATPTASPTDCLETFDVNALEKIGMEDTFTSFPEGLVQVVASNGETVSVKINNVFEDSVSALSIQYDSAIDSKECSMQTSFDSPITVEAVCFGNNVNVALVNVAVYFGDANSEECETCQPPESSSSDTVFFSYEIPCIPVCETAAPSAGPSAGPSSGPTATPTIGSTPSPTAGPTISNAPTSCLDTFAVNELEKIGMEDTFTSFPEGLVQTVASDGETVSVKVNNVFDSSVTAVSIHYDSAIDTKECSMQTSFDIPITFDAVCYGMDASFAVVNVVVYFGDANSEECETCQPPESSSSDTVFFSYEIPCIPVCETAAPSAGPSAGPSGGPTVGSTSSPTAGPTISASPTNCIAATATHTTEQIGMTSSVEGVPDGFIRILDSDGETVSVKITDVFEDDISALSVGYYDSSDSRECQMVTHFKGSLEVEAVCVGMDNEFAEVSVVVYFGTANSEACETCQPPESTSDDTVFYSFEIPCRPVCDTSAPTSKPSAGPTSGPSSGPTSGPTNAPSGGPTAGPTAGPTGSPTPGPTSGPTAGPTSSPSAGPTSGPTAGPTSSPSAGPTKGPTAGPTAGPTSGPTVGPTSSPSAGPTSAPTSGPTAGPTFSPSAGPTAGPTAGPSGGPTSSPSSGPTAGPTAGPTSGPTSSPSSGPTVGPTAGPSAATPAPTMSLSPTACYEKEDPVLIETIGEVPFPTNALKITKRLGSSVQVTVADEWESATVLSVLYDDSATSHECATVDGSLTFVSDCDADFEVAKISIFVSFGESDDEKCEQCSTLDGSEANAAQYYFEIPCTAFCDTFAPSAAPSDSYYPSSDPTITPTAGPSSSPSAGPSAGPSSGPSAGPSAGPTSGPSTY